MAVIYVRYWRGTREEQGRARTYRGAMRIASRNQNSRPPTFRDSKGRKLYDDGVGLAYEPDSTGKIVYAL